jgi:hypothetical protein
MDNVQNFNICINIPLSQIVDIIFVNFGFKGHRSKSDVSFSLLINISYDISTNALHLRAETSLLFGFR